jgi:hypothetical protein
MVYCFTHINADLFHEPQIPVSELQRLHFHAAFLSEHHLLLGVNPEHDLITGSGDTQTAL